MPDVSATSPTAAPGAAFDTVARVIRHIRMTAAAQPGLEELAEVAGLSPAHLQRLFSDWAGVSPKRFLQSLTARYAVECLRRSAPAQEAAWLSGLSSPGRLHDLVVAYEAMTPAKVRAQGEDIEVWYGAGMTPFGQAVVGWTSRGLCFLEFSTDDLSADALKQRLQSRWPRATTLEDAVQAQALLERVFQQDAPGRPLHVHVRGTNFQLKVWSALIETQRGERLSYGELAARAGAPGAQRAVGTALASNSIGYLIPCHRVIRESGAIGQYRWGIDRKMALLGWEAAKRFD